MDTKQHIKKFTCYFCNKCIQNETEVGHTAVCANVLVPCPNKCGSYVVRADLQKHKNECVNRTSTRIHRLSNAVNGEEYPATDPSISSLDRYNTKRLQNRIPQRESEIFQEIKRLSSKIRQLEITQINQQNSNTQNPEELKNISQHHSNEIDKLKYQSNVLSHWKNTTQRVLENLVTSLNNVQTAHQESSLRWQDVQEKIIRLEKVQIEVSFLKESFYKEQVNKRTIDTEVAQNIDNIKDEFIEEKAAVAALWNDHKVSIDGIKHDIQDIRKMTDEQVAKYTNVTFDLRAVNNIASEAAERMEILEREFRSTKKEIDQIKLDIEILEDLATSERSTYGKMIWKITELESKLKRTRMNETVIKGPIFYSHEFGYKIRLLLYLNGLKKWKDRYALLSLHVLKGEYDMLLTWPCNIDGVITLMDLENVDLVKPFSKYISAKRQCGDEEDEDPQESSSNYIFIPHSTLFKSNYVKDDSIFFKLIINQKHKTETSL